MDASDFHRFNPLKILVHSDRLRQIADGGLPYPVIWHIYPTNACNSKCSHCIMKTERAKGGQLSARQLVLAINEANHHGATTMHFSGGGEPTLNPYLSYAAGDAHASGLAVALSTNGILPAPAVDYLRVSIDAGCRETYRKVRGVDCFDRVVANIKKARPRKDLGLAMLITDTPDVDWATELRWLHNIAKEVRADFIHIRPAWYDRQSTIPWPCELCAGDLEAPPVYYRRDKFDRSWKTCCATPLNVVVTANGEFALCQDRPDLTFGRLEDGFGKAWSSKAHLDLLSRHFPDEGCPRCVMGPYHEIIEQVYIRDEMRLALV